MQHPNVASRPDRKWANKFAYPDWRHSVQSIIETGKLLKQKREELSRENFDKFVITEYLMNPSSGNKLIIIAQHPVISDPKNFDRLPCAWGKLYELSFIPDEQLQKYIDDGTVHGLTKYDIWKIRGDDRVTNVTPRVDGVSRQHRTANLFRRRKPTLETILPPGKTLSQLVGAEIDQEGPDFSLMRNAKKIGMGERSFALAREMVLLSRRNDLTREDAETVREAIAEMDEYLAVRRPYRSIQHISKKVWREKAQGRNRVIRVGKVADKKRTNAFNNAVVVVCDTCNTAVEIEIPFLSAEETASAISKLTEAGQSLRQLVKRIKGAR